MSRQGTLNVPESWKSLREELSSEEKEPSVTRLVLEDLSCSGPARATPLIWCH